MGVAASVAQVSTTRASTIRWDKLLRSAGFYAALLLMLAPVLFVFYWMIVTSLKGQTSVTAYPPEFLFRPTLDNYRKVLRDTPFPSFLLNSVVVIRRPRRTGGAP